MNSCEMGGPGWVAGIRGLRGRQGSRGEPAAQRNEIAPRHGALRLLAVVKAIVVLPAQGGEFAEDGEGCRAAHKARDDELRGHAACCVSERMSDSAAFSLFTASTVAPLRPFFQREGVVGAIPARSQIADIGTRCRRARSKSASMGFGCSMLGTDIGRAA